MGNHTFHAACKNCREAPTCERELPPVKDSAPSCFKKVIQVLPSGDGDRGFKGCGNFLNGRPRPK
jgi:hypothetical protein